MKSIVASGQKVHIVEATKPTIRPSSLLIDPSFGRFARN